MKIFKGQNLIEFAERFKTDQDCREYLSEIKWSEQYVCRKCSHTKSQIRKDFARTCNICSDTESAMANTLFHKVKFGLKKAFFICFEMSTSTKSLSASQTAVRFGVHERTARLFMHKVREAMKSSGDFPMTGVVNIDEYVVGGYEEGKPGRSYDSTKKKAVCAVELTDDGKVKRFYTFQIPDYSSQTERKFVLKPTREISFEFIKYGYEVIQRYSSGIRLENKTNNYCFDDLGTENNLKYFGNECNVMAEIILSRYDIFISKKIYTHITTNLSASEIEAAYGNRVRSRLRNMLNLIVFDKTTKDKR